MDTLVRWLPRAVALLGFAVYALCVPPGPAAGDSAQLAANAFQLGGDGAPLVAALARVAAFVPLGELSFRMHLVSSVSAALAMLWVARLVVRARPDLPGLIAAGAGALVLGVSLVVAHHATSTSALAPTAALLAGALVLYDRVARGGDARAGLSLALVVGLAAGGHASGRLMLVVPAGLLFAVRLRRGARWPLLAPLVAIGVAAAVHLGSPTRAATGRLETFEPASAPAGKVSAAQVAGDLADDLGVLALVAGAGGALWLARERRARWLLAPLVASSVTAVLHAAAADDGAGAIVLALVVACLTGFGIGWLGRFAGRAGPAVAAVAGVLVITPAVLVTLPRLVARRADDRRETIERVLDAAAPGRGQPEKLPPAVRLLRVTESARPDLGAPPPRP